MKLIGFVMLLFCLSCSSAQTNEKHVINLDGEKKPALLFSEMFKRAKTIILETNENCLIGIITEIQYFDNNLFVLDGLIANSVLVFDTEGRFLRKIGRVGTGPGEYKRIGDFTIDAEKREIYLLDYGMWIHKYKFDGTHISTIRIDAPETNMLSIQYYDNHLYADVCKFDPANNDCMLFRIDPENGKVQTKSLPVSSNKNWNELFNPGIHLSGLV
jgi:hypothetical protein